MMRVKRDQLRRGFGEVAPSIVLKMPFMRDDIAQERVERLTLGDEALIQESRVPIVKDAADVENDRGGTLPQPWRALKRRLVLLIT